jgi:bifunctional diaminopimelate decarboxylase / aspartate kinase
MRQIIIKFGGTSVSSRETWEHIQAIAQNHINQGVQPIIVCSALSQASNKLDQMTNAALLDKHHNLHAEFAHAYTELANALAVDSKHIKADLTQLKQWLTGIALLNEAPAKTRAQVLSLGELMLTRLGHIFLEQNNINCGWFDAREALKTTPVLGGDNVNYLNAFCASKKNQNLAYQLANTGKDAIITQGFIASNEAGETVLLGRGGSDTSATLLAASLEADACEIWTDVPGIYTANPHQMPHARLLKQLNYNEAQEIASMGAKVLHPPCIPPVRHANIPLFVKYTKMPEHTGTRITQDTDNTAPPIKSIQVKHSITLISIDTLTMWQQVGFLSDIFIVFKQHEFSVDLLSSSEFNVTLSLDSNGLSHPRKALDALLVDLNQLGRAKIIEPCSAVSLVGHHIRTVLPQLGPALEVFEAKQIYLMSLASNDLNLTFVVDESQANKLSQQLHSLLIENNPQSFYYSKSWQEQFGTPSTRQMPWWETSRDALLAMAEKQAPCYVYHAPSIASQADKLLQLKTIDQLFYAMKANSNPGVLTLLEAKGIGFECVSIQELQYVLSLFPKINPNRLLFTPNFAPQTEYKYALSIGCHITIDSLYPLEYWPKLFTGHDIFLRIDPGSGAGHHKYVCTGGNESKFGIPRASVAQAAKLTQEHNIRVVGLHAHSGSGILSPGLWQETAGMLIDEAKQFPDVRVINLGGGLGIVDKPSQNPLDIPAFDASLKAVKSQSPKFSFWLEPGRFFVAESGVILAHVTQCKSKGRVRFIGIDTGMNSLIRPMLYGAYHEIVNLSRFTEEKTGFAHIVGPICESADTLGYDRLLPETHEGDVILIANTGAYGQCMSSSYNMREPAKDLMFDAC